MIFVGWRTNCRNKIQVYSFVDHSYSLSCSYLLNLQTGVIIPPTPSKQTLGRFDDEFVESRRRGLEQFLKRIASNELLCDSSHFITFLQGEEAEMSRAKDEAKASKTKMSTTMMSVFSSTVNKVTAGVITIDKSADDMAIDNIQAYVSLFQKCLAQTLKEVETYCKKSRDTGCALKSVADSFEMLATTEGSELQSLLSKSGSTLASISTSKIIAATEEVRDFEEPLEEYVRFTESVQDALKRREANRTDYINALTDHHAKDQSYQKVLGVPGKDSDAKSKQEKVVAAQAVVDKTKQDLDDCSNTLIKNFDNFKQTKAYDFKSIFGKLIQIQLEALSQQTSFFNDMQGFLGVGDDRPTFITTHKAQAPTLPSVPNPFADEDEHTEV